MTIRSVAKSIAWLLITLAALWAVGDLIYFWELRQIKAELQRVPGTRIIYIWGAKEDLTLQRIFADLDVPGHGQVRLSKLTKSSFSQGPSSGLQVRHIGHRYPLYVEYPAAPSSGSELRYNSLGVGIPLCPDCDFTDLLPVRVLTVQDAVENYDVLLARVEKFPVCPAYFEHLGRSGRFYRICANLGRDVGKWPSPETWR